MKKRIIASILVVVMLVLSLASCGAYDFSKEDLSDYVSVDYDKLTAALAAIKIEDGDFGHLESERQEYITEAIYAAYAKKLFANAEELDADKHKADLIGDKDIVFYSYYCTDAEGNIFYFENMNAATNIGADLDKVKADYYINLASFDEDDELKAAIAAALAGKDASDHIYAVNGEKGEKIEIGDTIVVSYKRNFILKNKQDETKQEATINQTADYELVKVALDSDHPLGKYLAEKITEGKEKTSVSVGNSVVIATSDTATTSEPEITLSETYKYNNEDYTFDKATYSAIKVLWKVDEQGAAIEVKHTPFEEEVEEGKDTPKHEVKVSTKEGTKVNLTNKELTYHVYPVFYLDMPEEINALNILEFITGSAITLRVEDDASTSKNESAEPSFDIFEDSAYADKVKPVIEAVQKLYKGTFEADSVLETLGKAATNADKARVAFEEIFIEIPDKDAAIATAISEIKKAKTEAADAVTTLKKISDDAAAALTAFGARTDDNAEKYDAKKSLADLAKAAYDDVVALKGLIDAADTAADAYNSAAEADKEDKKTTFTNKHLAAYDKAEELEEKWADANDEVKADSIYAKREAIRAELAKLVAIKAADTETETLGDKLAKEYKDDQYETAEHSYKEDIIKKVNEEIYKIVFESDDIVKVTAYPEEVVEEFYKNLYESYEHDFYTGKALDKDGKETSETNYKKYGKLEDYLYEITEAKKTGKENRKEAIEAAITAEAESLVAPLLKLYAVSKVLDDKGAGDILKGYYEADIAAGVYESTFEPKEYEYDDSISERKNEKAKKKLDKQNEKNAKAAEEQAEKNKQNLLDAADSFLVDKKVYKEYKKSQGSVYARQLEEYYGEINLRAILQANRLLDYLTHYAKEYDAEEKAAHATHTETAVGTDKEYKINFSTVKYSFKADE